MKLAREINLQRGASWSVTRRREAGVLLVECLIYLSVWSVLLGLSFAAFYRVWDNATRLRRSAADIARVLQAGERWRDGSLRPAFEDWVGAGAILSHLPGMLSPEAHAAVAAYHSARQDLASLLKRCSSGKELIQRGFEHDVALASSLDISACVPTLVQGRER